MEKKFYENGVEMIEEDGFTMTRKLADKIASFFYDGKKSGQIMELVYELEDKTPCRIGWADKDDTEVVFTIETEGGEVWDVHRRWGEGEPVEWIKDH